MKEAKAVADQKANVLDTAFARAETRSGKEKLVPLTTYVRCFEGVNTMAIKADLTRHRYLYNTKGIYRVFSKYLGEDKLFVERMNPDYPAPIVLLTKQGMMLLSSLYKDSLLTMKRGFVIK